ncbi:MAG: helix-turn-helix domain-containing protein, partial [Flavobacteriaceae bacterium]|nr:helix-turn-helix domain-containing protein [Flavobacteriaceae bacterium]
MNGLEIREIRKELGVTQEEFARLLNVSKNSVQLWETEKRNPKHDKILLIKETYEKHTNKKLDVYSRNHLSEDRKILLNQFTASEISEYIIHNEVTFLEDKTFQFYLHKVIKEYELNKKIDQFEEAQKKF